MLVVIAFTGLPPAPAGFLLCLLFDPEDDSDIFLRNIGLTPNNTALHPKKTALFITVFFFRVISLKIVQNMTSRELDFSHYSGIKSLQAGAQQGQELSVRLLLPSLFSA
jgi:hypothetical protein